MIRAAASTPPLCCSLAKLARTSTHLIVALIVCACSASVHTVKPTEDLDQIEAKLKSVLPNRWSVTKNGNVFQLTRSNKLWVYSPVQRDAGLTLDQWVKKTGVEVIYAISLRFEPLMPKGQYEQIKSESERGPYEKIVNECRLLSASYSQATVLYLPRSNARILIVRVSFFEC